MNKPIGTECSKIKYIKKYTRHELRFYTIKKLVYESRCDLRAQVEVMLIKQNTRKIYMELNAIRSEMSASIVRVTFRQYLLYKIQQLSRRSVLYILITCAARAFFMST